MTYGFFFFLFSILGLKESPLITLDESILLAEIREEMGKQVGVKYDFD